MSRVPTALKILRGNPGHQKLNAHEPKPEVILPEAPEELSDDAQRIWQEYGAQLAMLGVMSRIDGATFATFCQTYARWLECNTYLRDAPLLVDRPGGGLEINPALKVLDQLQSQLLKVAGEFGLSPSSRAKITTTTTRTDDLEDFLGTGTGR